MDMKRREKIAVYLLALLFLVNPGLLASAMAQEAPSSTQPKMKSRSIYKVNINKAGRAELMSFALIGPILAERIIKGRPYKAIEEVQKVEGMSEDIYASIQGDISIADPVIEEEKDKGKEKPQKIF